MNPNFSDGLLLWMEKLFHLWKMFFFHIALSSSHESFNGVTPSSGSKISGGFMGHFIRWGNRSLIFIDLYRPTLLRKTSADLERVSSVRERFVFQHLNFPQMTSGPTCDSLSSSDEPEFVRRRCLDRANNWQSISKVDEGIDLGEQPFNKLLRVKGS